MHHNNTGTSGRGCAALRMAERAARPAAGERLRMPLRCMRDSTARLAATMPTPCQAPHCTLLAGSPAHARSTEFSWTNSPWTQTHSQGDKQQEGRSSAL